MEAINQFYIDLDLSGVTRIYDYGNNEHLTPGSDGQWDPSELRQRFPSQGPLESFEDDTKNRLMDLAFAAKGCLKTDSHYAKAKNKTSHNIVDKLCESESHKTSYNIFDRLCESELPYRLLPEVEPGGVVKGNVILDLKEDIEIEKFTVSLKGGARVQIRVQTTNGECEGQTIRLIIKVSEFIGTINLQSWWRHQMKAFSALLALCAGNSSVTGKFPSQRPLARSFDVFFDLHPRKRLSNQSRRGWLKTLSRSLWRHWAYSH